MPYTIAWMVAKRVLNIRIYGVFSIDEIRAYNQDITRFVREGFSPVHCITDLSDLKQVNYDFAQLKGALSHLHEPNMGIALIVGVRVIAIRNLAALLLRTANLRCLFVDTTSQAVDLLLKEEPLLAASIWNDPDPAS